jgi:hypothetical protein
MPRWPLWSGLFIDASCPIALSTGQTAHSCVQARRPSIDAVHLRRALLLFAIVLGLAALATALSQPRDEEPRPADVPASPSEPTVGEAPPRPDRKTLLFEADGRPQRRRAETGAPAVVTVEVPVPGQVSVPELGLTAPADPLTPARFDVLLAEPGSYELRFTPAGEDESRRAGALLVTETR